MPYAIIRTGGHQEKVTPGEQITVDRLKEEVGQEVTFVPLVVSMGDGTLVSDKKVLGDTAKVVGKVLEHLKGDKVDVFQYRHKTGYRRHTGHRQPLTLVEIASITLGDEVFNAPEPGTAEAAPAQEPAETEVNAVSDAVPAKAKKVPAKKASTTKPAAKAKAPAKKPKA